MKIKVKRKVIVALKAVFKASFISIPSAVYVQELPAAS